MKIALVTPKYKEDYLTNTIIDGLITLSTETDLTWFCPEGYQSYLPINLYQLNRAEFITFAKEADLIFFCWGKYNLNSDLVNEINLWDKVIYIDGSEPGGNKRFDSIVQQKILAGDEDTRGAINNELLQKCSLYFRREKPYVDGVIPLPFGIERRYLDIYNPTVEKDIDFVCIFGQAEFPPLRAEVKNVLSEFCQAHNLKCVTETTKGFLLSDDKTAGRTEFYQLLARAKVGISTGGGGFDTARFWEILGNNCLLLTETIDIYEPTSKALTYDRIYQFSNLLDFDQQLKKLAEILQHSYPPANLESEYNEILAKHSTKARVLTILEACRNKNLIS